MNPGRRMTRGLTQSRLPGLGPSLKSRNLYPEGCKMPNRQTLAPNKSLRGPEEQFRPALHSSVVTAQQQTLNNLTHVGALAWGHLVFLAEIQ